VKERVLEATAIDGDSLRGIVTVPDHPNGVAIILLSAGIKYRTGPNRLYVHLARELAKRGYLVLRWDSRGMGESDGSIPVGPLTEVWRTIETGRYVNDAFLAMGAVRSGYDVKKVVLGGLCGGALTAQMAAAERPDSVDGVISMNTVVLLSGGRRADPEEEIAHPGRRVAGYLKKGLTIEGWRRIAKGDIGFRRVARTIRAAAAGILRRIVDDRTSIPPDMNPLFPRSFTAVQKSGIPHLLVFSGRDESWWTFEDVFLTRNLGGRKSEEHYAIEVIHEANHNFFLIEWRSAVISTIVHWLETRLDGTEHQVRQSLRAR
jgi:pimeloyl-ACP methyl ester carboxylesterase